MKNPVLISLAAASLVALPALSSAAVVYSFEAFSSYNDNVSGHFTILNRFLYR